MRPTPAAIGCSLGSVKESDEVADSQQPTPPAVGQGPEEEDPQTEGDKAVEAAAEKSDAAAHTVGVLACPHRVCLPIGGAAHVDQRTATVHDTQAQDISAADVTHVKLHVECCAIRNDRSL